jgi:transcriptional regulator with XRE-family HTH domain
MVSAEVRSVMGNLRISGLRLSQGVGVSQNYLSKRLRDELPFTIDDIELIAGVLGVDYETLVLPAAHSYDGSGPKNHEVRGSRA